MRALLETSARYGVCSDVQLVDATSSINQQLDLIVELAIRYSIFTLLRYPVNVVETKNALPNDH